MMWPCSSTTSTPSSIVLNSVSRKLRSRASRWTTVCKPSTSNLPMRPSTLSRKLDLVVFIERNQDLGVTRWHKSKIRQRQIKLFLAQYFRWQLAPKIYLPSVQQHHFVCRVHRGCPLQSIARCG